MIYQVILPNGAVSNRPTAQDAIYFAAQANGSSNMNPSYLKSLGNALEAAGTVSIGDIVIVKLGASAGTQEHSYHSDEPSKTAKLVILVVGIAYLMYVVLISQ